MGVPDIFDPCFPLRNSGQRGYNDFCYGAHNFGHQPRVYFHKNRCF